MGEQVRIAAGAADNHPTGLLLIWVTKYISKKDDYAPRMMFWITTGTMIIMIAVTAFTLYMFYTHS